MNAMSTLCCDDDEDEDEDGGEAADMEGIQQCLLSDLRICRFY